MYFILLIFKYLFIRVPTFSKKSVFSLFISDRQLVYYLFIHLVFTVILLIRACNSTDLFILMHYHVRLLCFNIQLICMYHNTSENEFSRCHIYIPFRYKGTQYCNHILLVCYLFTGIMFVHLFAMSSQLISTLFDIIFILI